MPPSLSSFSCRANDCRSSSACQMLQYFVGVDSVEGAVGVECDSVELEQIGRRIDLAIAFKKAAHSRAGDREMF